MDSFARNGDWDDFGNRIFTCGIFYISSRRNWDFGIDIHFGSVHSAVCVGGDTIFLCSFY